jgi:acetoin utilization deacetylase AcuC-like enzyme
MLVLHDEATLLHETIEILNGESMRALESPSRILQLVSAISQAHPVHELRVLSSTSASLENIQALHDLVASTHDKQYLEHLRTIHAAWVKAGIIQQSGSVLPECFPLQGLTIGTPKPPRDLNARPGYFAFDLSTGIAEHTWTSALASANLAAEGAKLIVRGRDGLKDPTKDVLALCRPPGHHCTTNLAGGYCYLNNAVVAVEALRHWTTPDDKRPLRIAILDLDFHHGNGTQSYFYKDPKVFYASVHGDGEYPYYTGGEEETGEGDGIGTNLNLPLPLVSSLEAYLEKLEVAMDRLGSFKPDYLLVSLGFDTYEHDPLGAFAIKTADYRVIAEKARTAAGLKSVPALLLLEGGYVLDALGPNMLSFLAGWETAK